MPSEELKEFFDWARRHGFPRAELLPEFCSLVAFAPVLLGLVGPEGRGASALSCVRCAFLLEENKILENKIVGKKRPALHGRRSAALPRPGGDRAGLGRSPLAPSPSAERAGPSLPEAPTEQRFPASLEDAQKEPPIPPLPPPLPGL